MRYSYRPRIVRHYRPERRMRFLHFALRHRSLRSILTRIVFMRFRVVIYWIWVIVLFAVLTRLAT